MPAPTLRHYSAPSATFTQANTEVAVGAAAPAGRALVVAKVIVAAPAGAAAATTFLLRPGVGTAVIAAGVTLNPGEVYTETGIVLLPGEQFFAATSTVSGISVSIFGEEVDA